MDIKAEGRTEGKLEVALKMLKAGMDINQIADLTGLTIPQLESLQTR